jgi:hypothetical protein
MATDLAAIAAFAEGKTGEIDIPTIKPDPSQWIQRGFRLNNAIAKVLAVILAYQKPLDFISGQTIDVSRALSWQNGKEFHHFFPQAYLKATGVSQSKASSLANMVYLSSASNKTISDRAPADYLKDLMMQDDVQTRARLLTNLVEEDALQAALVNDYGAFLEARAATIDRVARQLAGW